MMDYENIFKDFLDLIYQNDILPNEIVCVLEKYSKNRDFRLICDLLYYKEKYCKTAGDPRTQQFYTELTMHARALQDINIWRDAMSLNNLSYLKAALNNDAHNDTHRSDPAIIKPMIQQLIRAANLKPDGYLINNIDKKSSGSSGIGKIVRETLIPGLNKIPSAEIKKLQTKQYSKNTFDINYPLLSKNRFDSNGRPRYYATPIRINGADWYVCQEWYARSEPKLKVWLALHNIG